jgi:hypothetical protein
MRRRDALLAVFEGMQLQARLKKLAYLFMGLLAVYALARGVATAAAKPFWFDEFFTLTIAGQASVPEMWNELRRGFDTQPPLFYLIERAALLVPVKKEIALRLPSILAFPCILACVFVFARKRLGEVIACLCALLVLATCLFHTYLVDARPYNMTVGCIALAMVCYQRLPSWKWTVLFGLSLVLAESLHYYSVFVMAPFGIAEAVMLLKTRKVRWPVWLAMVCGTLPLLVSLPYLLKSKTFYGPHYFARPELARVKDYYGGFFYIQRELGMALLVVSLISIVWALPRRNDRPGEEQDAALPLVEGALLLGLNLLPLIIYVMARITHGGLGDRYTLATAIGLILGMAWVLARLPGRAIALFAVGSVAILGIREMRFWQHGAIDPLTRNDSYASSHGELAEIQKLVQSGGHLGLPVVFDQEVLYPQIVYYGSPDWTRRVVFLTDEAKEFAFDGNDTAVKIMNSFRDFFPVRLADYGEFTTIHAEFVLYAEPVGWMLAALQREGATAQVLGVDGWRRLYLVRMNRANGGTSASAVQRGAVAASATPVGNLGKAAP